MKAKDALVKCQQTIKSCPKQVAAIVATVIVAVALVCLPCLRGCDSNEIANEVPTGTAGQKSTSASLNASTAEAESIASETAQGEPLSGEHSTETTAGQDATGNSLAGSDGQTAGATSGQASESASSGNSDTASSGGNDSTPATPSKTWVVDYTQVWVQDSAAWDESIPTYGTQEKSICNVCGADITGNEVAHGKAHMMAGEGSGHHTEMIQVVTGSQIVHHEATGHYETVESGGHWE